MTEHSDSKQKGKVKYGPAVLQSFFEDLGLWQKYYPQRLTMIDSLCVKEKTLNAASCNDVKEVPWLVLQKIMSFDARSRTNLLKLHETISYDDFDDDFEDDDEYEETNTLVYHSNRIHPMDVILALFLCADDFLCQAMMVRLISCQLAIPLVLRDPFTQKLMLPLWALSSIVKSWRTVDSKGKIINFEDQLTKFEMPIVSIIRLGNHEVSKSKLLNNVISNSSHQNYFFHRDCNGGSFKRLLGNGIIDMCWYLPAGKEDVFPEPITFLNLHGDACNSKNEKQVEFLCKISTFCLVLAPGNFLNAKSVSILKKFPKFTLLIKGKKPTNLDTEFSKVHAISLMNKNEHEIKNCLRTEISTEVIFKNAAKRPIESLDKIAHNCQIEVNSRTKFFSEGKAKASLSFAKIHSKPEFKAKNLPLQGKALWQAWATYDKEQKRQMNRGSKDIRQYEAEIEEKKCQIRAEQGKQLTKLSPIMTLFMENLKSSDSKTTNYYLQCLKLHLNNLSRNTISQVHIEYCETHRELNKFQKPNQPRIKQNGSGHITPNQRMTPQEKKLKEKLDMLHGELIDLSFGLEHLLRETGQIYEISLDDKIPKGMKKEFLHLPGEAAKLLIDGYPIELMDGDAAHVPIKWVQAVITEAVKLLVDPRIFVLSVLGLQSTGKSTLLNTVFGLQFNVSSGRCTRGAYMQLLPISEDMRSDIECDYILVIDTEGLRAPELDSIQSQKHDNELATFVIGLANDTLINIYGEVAGDMDDILQITVHAFIRMREIELKPSCQFVHQNAGAGNKTGIGRDKFIQKLDETTRYAASEEGCLHQFQHFRDVIKFDDQNDVHHFENLWVGNPPMAPVNPGYSASAQSLKSRIIKQIRETNCSRLSSFSCKLNVLWNALLAENFVFSFKNSLECKAYNLLETSYNQWEWELKAAVLKWEEKMTKEVKAASNEITLDKIVREKLNHINGELTVLISETHTRLSEEMVVYFQESRQSDVIVQWKSTFERRLEEQAQLLKKEKISHFEQLCNGNKALTSIRKQHNSFKQEIISKASEVVEVLSKQGTKPTREQTKLEFNKAWNEMLRKLPVVHQFQDPIVVKRDVETELISFLGRGAEKRMVKLQTSQKSSQAVLKLKIRKEIHLSCHVKGLAFKTGTHTDDVNIVSQAQKKTNTILSIVPRFLQEFRNFTYSRSLVTKLLKELNDAVSLVRECDHEFTFTQKYRVDLFLTACNYAIMHFEQMVETFNRKNDPVVCLEEELKGNLFEIFKNKCFQIEHGIAVANTLSEVLTKSIHNNVKSSLGRQIVAKMKASDICFKNKQALKAKILVDLAENLQKNGDFEPFILYLTCPQKSFQKWGKEYTRQYCDAREPGSVLSRVQVIALDEIMDLIYKVEFQVKKLRRKYESHSTVSMCVWLSEFSESLKENGCHVDVSMLQKSNKGQIVDVVSFTVIVEKEIKKVCEKVKRIFEKLKFDDMINWEKQVEDVFENLAGCCAQCPFCGEICDNTSPCGEGVKHQVEQHRIECTKGWHFVRSRELGLGLCSSLVTGNDNSAHFSKSNEKYPSLYAGIWFLLIVHPQPIFLYKEYYTVYPDWLIPASLTDAPTYWKWFVANYIHRLAEYYSCTVCSIPSSWKYLKWEDVKEELQRKYR